MSFTIISMAIPISISGFPLDLIPVGGDCFMSNNGWRRRVQPLTWHSHCMALTPHRCPSPSQWILLTSYRWFFGFKAANLQGEIHLSWFQCRSLASDISAVSLFLSLMPLSLIWFWYQWLYICVTLLHSWSWPFLVPSPVWQLEGKHL